MRKITTALVLSVATLLSACGGKSGHVSVSDGDSYTSNGSDNYLPNRPGNTDTSAAEQFADLYEDINAQNDVVTTALADERPRVEEPRYVLFGVPSGTVPNTEWNVLGGGTYDGVTVGALTFVDSENADRVVEYLKSAALGDAISTFNSTVTVRISRDAHDYLRDNVKAVVAELNRLLPEDRSLVIGADVDHLPDPHQPYERGDHCRLFCPLLVADNEIVIAAIDNLLEQGYFGRMYSDDRLDGSRRAAYLTIDSGAGSSYKFTNLIAHEMLHALGLDNHVSPSIFPEALLSNGGSFVSTEDTPDRLLSAPTYNFGSVCLEEGCIYYVPTIRAVEGEAVWALYNRFAPTGFVEKGDISVDGLGYWEDRAYRMFGVVETPGGDVGFGVDFRRPSHWARPWFGGVENFSYLQGVGTSVWNGAILGVTPALHPVVGKARVSVDLDSSTGNIDFDNLKTDDGSGVVTWGDGRLGYAIGVNTNGIFRTGGSEGELFGAFLGGQHEGVGGTLERADLVAAFGAKREVRLSGPNLTRNERRVAVMAGNDTEIGDAVRDVIKNGPGFDRVNHSWNGSNLSVTISATNQTDTVSLHSRTNSVHDFEPTDSPGRGGDFTRREFDIGKTSNGTHTIGRFGVDWSNSDVADHLTYGYWLTVDSSDERPSQVDTGAFVDGPEFDTSPNLPVSGTAYYLGEARGLHTVKYKANEFAPKTDEFRIAEFKADANLNLLLDTGMVYGLIDNIYYTTDEEGVVDGSLHESGFPRERPFQLWLEDASLYPDGSFSGGAVAVVNPNPNGPQIVQSNGSWQGDVSSMPVSHSVPYPRLIAGTFATEFRFPEGTVGQYVGSFIAPNTP